MRIVASFVFIFKLKYETYVISMNYLFNVRNIPRSKMVWSKGHLSLLRFQCQSCWNLCGAFRMQKRENCANFTELSALSSWGVKSLKECGFSKKRVWTTWLYPLTKTLCMVHTRYIFVEYHWIACIIKKVTFALCKVKFFQLSYYRWPKERVHFLDHKKHTKMV